MEEQTLQQPVEETNPPIEQTPQEPPKSKAGLIIVIVLVSLLVIGGAITVYLFYAQDSADVPQAPSLGMPVPGLEDVDDMVVEDEEVTLETYTNEKNNYQLQHQDDWEIKTLVSGEARILSPNDIETDCKGECGFSALISNIRKVEFGTIVSYLENEKTRLMSEGGEARVNACLKDLEYFQLGDHRAAQYITCDFANPTIISFMDNSRLVYVTVYATDNSELLEILSTFKFNGLVDTSDWQTYRNEEYGYELKYPNHLSLTEGIIGPNICGYGCFSVEPTELTLEEYITAYNAVDKDLQQPRIYKQDNVIVDSIPATRLVGYTAIGVDNNIIYMQVNNSTLVFNGRDFDEIPFDTIISTLKTWDCHDDFGYHCHTKNEGVHLH